MGSTDAPAADQGCEVPDDAPDGVSGSKRGSSRASSPSDDDGGSNDTPLRYPLLVVFDRSPYATHALNIHPASANETAGTLVVDIVRNEPPRAGATPSGLGRYTAFELGADRRFAPTTGQVRLRMRTYPRGAGAPRTTRRGAPQRALGIDEADDDPDLCLLLILDTSHDCVFQRNRPV
jgi:hypothetical protein